MNNNAKTILETIVSMGYSKRGSIAYKCIDDIVAYFSVDCPSSLIYITFGIVPLFVPSEKYFTYSYASRMNEISPDLKIITKEDDYKVVLNWTLKFRSVIEATIESYISRISKANIMIDYCVNKFFSLPYDKDGEIASEGVISDSWLECLLKDEYYFIEPPKSTGREYFSPEYIENALKYCGKNWGCLCTDSYK